MTFSASYPAPRGADKSVSKLVLANERFSSSPTRNRFCTGPNARQWKKVLCLAAGLAAALAPSSGGGGEDERGKNVLVVVVADGLAGAVGAPWAFDDCCPPIEEGFCGGATPFGWFCADLCAAFSDCCPDAVEMCLRRILRRMRANQNNRATD